MSTKYHVFLFDIRNNKTKIFEDEIPDDWEVQENEKDDILVWSWCDEEAHYFCDHNRAFIFYNECDINGEFINPNEIFSNVDCHCDTSNILIEKIVRVDTGETIFSGELACYFTHLNEGKVQ